MTSKMLRRNLPAIGAATRAVIIFITVLSLPLAAADTLDLTASQTSTWILALYGLSGFLSLMLTFRYRQPLLLTGNLFVVIFINRLGNEFSFPELIGASILAGAIIFLISLLGLMERLANWIPVPIVFGLLAGAVVSFVADIFNQMGDAPILVGGTFLTYIISRGILGRRIPAIFPALIVGLTLAAVNGQFSQLQTPLFLDIPKITIPVLTLTAILNATPIFVILITLQSNLPSIRYLQSQDFQPPEFWINNVSGIGTIFGSFLGPTGISLSLPATSLVAGPEAGEQRIRHQAVFIAAGAAVLIGLLAGIATALAVVVPMPLLLTLAGLALVDVLSSALQEITRGPLLLGPLFAFVIALSEISLLGFGSFFWALVIGMGVSLLLERDIMFALRDENDEKG
jgi:benzoate membrane transport protein